VKRTVSFSLTTLLIALIAASTATAFAQMPSLSKPDPLIASYGKLPLSFETNEGQSDPSVQFLARGQGYAVFLGQGEATILLQNNFSSQTAKTSISSIGTSVLRLDLLRANRSATVIPEERQITHTNYFTGNDPSRWRTGIPNFARVRYKSVYDGIDVVYYGNQRRLEHDFVVAPGAQPGQISFAVTLGERSATSLRLDPVTGDLLLSTGASDEQGELRLLKPVAYQNSDHGRREIPAAYKLIAPDQIGFSIGRYDLSTPLVIDPVLVYSTYLGGSGAAGKGDQGKSIAVGRRGNAYVVGTTYSADFPVTRHTYQTHNHAPSGTSTVFVTKLNETGTALVYSTYLGGSGGDFGYGIALDRDENAYVTGATYSADFPVTRDAYQRSNPSKTSGASTGFAAKLDRDGENLEYATYLGGSGNMANPAHGDVGQAITVGAERAVYLTGYTWSSDFPVTDDAFQKHFAGSALASNAFVVKLGPDGRDLRYSTFLGGSGSKSGGDYGNAVALDRDENVVVAGTTNSSNFPVTGSAFQTDFKGSATAFVTELNRRGSEEIFSTYLGGSGGDSAAALALDREGSLYVAGNTGSTDFPLTADVLEGASSAMGPYLKNGPTVGFLTKLKGDGSALQYSTFVEGAFSTVTSLAVDNNGDAYVAGSAPTLSSGIPGGFQGTPDALTVPTSTGNSGFLVKLDSLASVLDYATLLGGEANDTVAAIALDERGNVYLTGTANSTGFPTSSGAFQSVNHAAATGGSNAFVSKFTLENEINKVAYTPLPSEGSTFLGIGQGFASECPGFSPAFSWSTPIFLQSYSLGPPMTGTVSLGGPYDPTVPGFSAPVIGTWSAGTPPGTTPFQNFQTNLFASSNTGIGDSVTYSGDSVYSGAGNSLVLITFFCGP
jgi:hypothetical protein